jgi:2-succinyl-5-enolpyruvyl-6-hydroxy-3-cyclohexene-1-carboxylate synthase
MALALRAASELACWVHIDERAGAFFALGAAKARRRPVAVLATSGTAVVNFAPAVAEARYGRVPLLLLTADRPPELQGIGAPQTIDQVDLYGRHAKWFVELPIPASPDAGEAHARAVTAQAIEVATTSPAGPVQINLPFREPLLPAGSLAASTSPSAAPDTAPSTRAAVRLDIEALASDLGGASRALLLCGPLDVPGFAEAVARLAASCDAAILADGLSGLRNGPHDRSRVIAHHDLLLRSDRFREAHRPDVIVRFGARPTSKALDQWLDGLDVPQWLVDDGHGWNLPAGPTLLPGAPIGFADAASVALAGRPTASSDWLARWRSADEIARRAIEGWQGSLGESFEGAVADALDAALPDGAVVLVGNSMPVRDLDTFMPSSPHARRVIANRGANGIDGQISTAMGLAIAQPGPVVAVVGDLSFMHDLNALVAARRLRIDLTVVLVDNNWERRKRAKDRKSMPTGWWMAVGG